MKLPNEKTYNNQTDKKVKPSYILSARDILGMKAESGE